MGQTRILCKSCSLNEAVWASLSSVVVGGHVLGIVCGSAWTWLIFYLVILTERLYVITYRTYFIFSPHNIPLLSCALENTRHCRIIKRPLFEKVTVRRKIIRLLSTHSIRLNYKKGQNTAVLVFKLKICRPKITTKIKHKP